MLNKTILIIELAKYYYLEKIEIINAIERAIQEVETIERERYEV